MCCRFKGILTHIHIHAHTGKHFEAKIESARKSCIQLCMQNAMVWKEEEQIEKKHTATHWNRFNRFLCWKRSCFVSIRWSFFLSVWRLFYCLLTFFLLLCDVGRILVCVCTWNFRCVTYKHTHTHTRSTNRLCWLMNSGWKKKMEWRKRIREQDNESGSFQYNKLNVMRYYDR